MSTLCDAALEYIESGRSIIPIRNGTKKPLIKWESYQNQIATPEDVNQWFKQWPDAQIAMVTGLVSGVAALDGDSSIGISWMKNNLPRTSVYQKTSKGYHAFYATNGRPVKNKVRIAPDVDVRGDGGYIVISPSIHPSGKQYELVFPIEGEGWEDLAEFPYDQLPGIEKKEPVSMQPVAEGERNITTARIAGKLIKDGTDYQGVLDYLLYQNSKCNPPQDEQAIEKTAESIWKTHFENHPFDVSNVSNVSNVSGVSDRKHQYAISKQPVSTAEVARAALFTDIKEYIQENAGIITISDLCFYFSLSTRVEKGRLYKALNDLKKQGICEKVTGRPGQWKVVDRSATRIDLFASVPQPLPIPLPVRLSRMVKIHSKDVIIVAGTTNSGKSSFLTAVAFMSALITRARAHANTLKTLDSSKGQNQYVDIVNDVLADKTMDYKTPLENITYLNSESPDELRRRVQCFPDCRTVFKKMAVYERMGNFSDMIDPDGLNIIDYMEINDEFYKVGQLISDVYQKLNTGVAFIAIQKSHGSEYGRGGAFTAEKARLYINLEENKPFGGVCKVTKAKSFINTNPNGLEIDYRLYDGWEIKPVSEWRYVNTKERARANKQYEADISGKREYAYEFKLSNGKTAGLNFQDRDKWIKAYPKAGVDEYLKGVAKASEWEPWLQSKDWFFQLSAMLKKREKTALVPVQQKLINIKRGEK